MTCAEFKKKVRECWSPGEVTQLFYNEYAGLTGTASEIFEALVFADARQMELSENGMEIGARGGIEIK